MGIGLAVSRRTNGQLGLVKDYEEFLRELDRVRKLGYDLLVPGGRLICVVGDVCLSRRGTTDDTRWSRRFMNRAEGARTA